MDQTSMADALNASAQPTSETVEAPAQETAQTEVASEATAPAPAQETQATTEVAPKSRAERGLISALSSMREKNKSLEAELAQYRGQNQQQVESYIDPSIQAYVGQLGAQVKGQLTYMSEELARQAHPDFDQAIDALEEASKQDPSLINVITESANPGEAAYQKGKEILFKKQHGNSPDQWRSSIEKELFPKIRQQVQAEFSEKLKGKSQQPTNISTARAAGGDAQPAWRPSGIGDLLGRKR